MGIFTNGSKYKGAKRVQDRLQNVLEHKEDIHDVLEDNHEDATFAKTDAEAVHATAKTEFDKVNGELTTAKGEVATAAAKPEFVAGKQKVDGLKAAHDQAQAELEQTRTRAKGFLNSIPADDHTAMIQRDGVRQARENAKAALAATDVDKTFKTAKANFAKAEAAASAKPGDTKLQEARSIAERELKSARIARRADPKYGEFIKARRNAQVADAQFNARSSLYELESKAAEAESAFTKAQAEFHATPEFQAHQAATEKVTELTKAGGRHAEASAKLGEAERTLASASAKVEAASKNVTHSVRGQDRLAKQIERQGSKVKQLGKKFRFGKLPKWGALGAGVAAAGALAYSMTKPSGRSDNGEAMQGLRDQMAENEAKLDALHSMTQQQPVMQQPIMVAATPQGPVATPYPPMMMVPANGNIPATSITGAGLQYQGQLAAAPGMQMGAPA